MELGVTYEIEKKTVNDNDNKGTRTTLDTGVVRLFLDKHPKPALAIFNRNEEYFSIACLMSEKGSNN